MACLLTPAAPKHPHTTARHNMAEAPHNTPHNTATQQQDVPDAVAYADLIRTPRGPNAAWRSHLPTATNTPPANKTNLFTVADGAGTADRSDALTQRAAISRLRRRAARGAPRHRPTQPRLVRGLPRPRPTPRRRGGPAHEPRHSQQLHPMPRPNLKTAALHLNPAPNWATTPLSAAMPRAPANVLGKVPRPPFRTPHGCGKIAPAATARKVR